MRRYHISSQANYVNISNSSFYYSLLNHTKAPQSFYASNEFFCAFHLILFFFFFWRAVRIFFFFLSVVIPHRYICYRDDAWHQRIECETSWISEAIDDVVVEKRQHSSHPILVSTRRDWLFDGNSGLNVSQISSWVQHVDVIGVDSSWFSMRSCGGEKMMVRKMRKTFEPFQIPVSG